MKKHILKNGIPVILEDMTGTDVITALVLFKVGSRNENKANNGVSHFVEHLFFKGTEHRPTTLDISRELDGIGADYNAFTSKDFTGYYIKTAKRHGDLAIDILEDILFHPIFDAEEIDRERGVIVEEINMYEDNPMVISDEFSEQLMFGADHPLGYRIAGPIKNIKTISRENIIKYRDEYYHPDNMIIIMTGNLPKNCLSAIEKRFGSAQPTKHKAPKQKKFVSTQKRPRLHLEKKNTAQAHMALTFPGPSYKSKDRPVADVASVILGGNMSSRLFINVRERKGLCYYIRSGFSPYEDCGAFTIQAGFDKGRIHPAIDAIINELKDFDKNKITKDELKKAKEFISGKLSLRLEDSENVSSFWGHQALFKDEKDWLTKSQYEKLIQGVSLVQVNRFIKKTFVSNKANLAIIGPYTKRQEASFKKHLKF